MSTKPEIAGLAFWLFEDLKKPRWGLGSLGAPTDKSVLAATY